MHYFARGLLGLIILTPLVGYAMGYWWGFGVAAISILVMTGAFDRKRDMEEKNEDLARRIARNMGNATKARNRGNPAAGPSTHHSGQSSQRTDSSKQKEPQFQIENHRNRLIEVVKLRMNQMDPDDG